MRARILITTSLLIPVSAAWLSAQATGIRDVSASDRTLIPLQTKLRYTTMVVLPDDEDIVDVVCGDRDYWVISASQNIAHIKPAKEAAATNLNLVTTRGTVYSFLLSEGHSVPPDLKVYVSADPSARRGAPKYVSAAQVTALEIELTQARAALDTAKAERVADQQRTEEAIATFKQQFSTRLQFAYGLAKYEKPFYVRSIWHDGQFTYIKSDARELPALYELHDGQPSLVNFQVQNGTYVVPKVLERGYLVLGTNRFSFQQGR
jgi:type IV secretion system protein VirB9